MTGNVTMTVVIKQYTSILLVQLLYRVRVTLKDKNTAASKFVIIGHVHRYVSYTVAGFHAPILA